MNNTPILERNLLALSSKDSRLSYAVGKSEPSEKVTFLTSKNGEQVPALRGNDRYQPLHSLFNAAREGNKIAKSYKHEGYIIFLGFGAGYHILPFLESKLVSHILIIDKDTSLFRSVLETIDLRKIILDPRVNFLIDADTKEIEEYFYRTYIPALCGDLQTVSLSSRLRSDSTYFEYMVNHLKECISSVSDDYTVQSYFGKKWFVNTLANLQAAQESTATLRPIRKALITGAGPSLELQVDTLKQQRSSGFLIATDTSFPALVEYGIKPDLVISIDCQQISYLHFLLGFPRDIPLILDLASPPDLTRLSDKLIFFTSGHPFSQYVNSHWRQFPYIDTSGGNVSHAAISLADALGAQEIHLFGTDFSFPEGKSYARGTYIYPFFRMKETRFDPVEDQFFSFILRNSHIIKDSIDGAIRYSTKPMISYKTRLEQSLAHLSSKIIPASGKGLPLNVQHEAAPLTKNKTITILFSAGKPSSSWYEFLQKYAIALSNLAPPEEPIAKYLADIDQYEWELWLTLLPTAATFRREQQDNMISGSTILHQVHEWSLTILDHYLHDSE
jgi:hypothetical protein